MNTAENYYQNRNEKIRKAYDVGVSILLISKIWDLSISRIRQIIYSK